MRVDYQSASSELARAWALVEAQRGSGWPPSRAGVLVRVVDLAALFVEHPLIWAAADAAVAGSSWDHGELSRRFLRELRAALRPCLGLGARWRDAIRRLGKRVGEEDERIRTAIDRWRVDVPWRGGVVRAGDALDPLPHAWEELGVDEIRTLAKRVLILASQSIAELAKLDAEEMPALKDAMHEAKVSIEAALDEMGSLDALAKADDLSATLAWLRSLHAHMLELRAGRLDALPLPSTHPMKSGPVQDGLLLNVERLVSDTRARLSRGMAQQYAVRRLKTLIERFERDELVTQISGLAKSKKPEDVIQDVVDRFLFTEGLFPITHCVAGQGRIDTFIDKHEHLFRDVEETHQNACLLELKQALRPSKAKSITEAQVRNAITLALLQAGEYREHMRTRPRWRDHDVFAVVVYAGPQRYHVHDERVVLIYVGDQHPSKGAREIAISDGG